MTNIYFTSNKTNITYELHTKCVNQLSSSTNMISASKAFDYLQTSSTNDNQKSTNDKNNSNEKSSRWGHIYEHNAAVFYNVYNNVTLIQCCENKIHPNHPWLSATPDAILISSNKKSLIEIKCPHLMWIPDVLPDKYYIQCQIQMAIFDVDSTEVFYCKFEEFDDLGKAKAQMNKLNNKYVLPIAMFKHYELSDYILYPNIPHVDGVDCDQDIHDHMLRMGCKTKYSLLRHAKSFLVTRNKLFFENIIKQLYLSHVKMCEERSKAPLAFWVDEKHGSDGS